jgi:transcriptional regulator with XRE-family HTH domain
MTVPYTPRQKQDPGGEWPSPPDPGDLSKRVALRRTELKLSLAQVAARTGLGRRYLEYLERYPARPDAAALRRIAAALRTTPAALLGAGQERPPGRGDPAIARTITAKLTTTECRRLIASGGVGRIAFMTLDGPVVLPVNFAVAAETIVIRTGECTLIATHADDRVAFEVDHVDDALCQGWSVLVRGQAHRVTQPTELHNMQEYAAVWPWAGGEREVYIRVIPSKITGRRIETRSALG